MEKFKYQAPEMEVIEMKPQGAMMIISGGEPVKDDEYVPGE